MEVDTHRVSFPFPNITSEITQSFPLVEVLGALLSITFPQLVSFKLHRVLSSTMKSHAILLHPAQDETLSFVQRV